MRVIGTAQQCMRRLEVAESCHCYAGSSEIDFGMRFLWPDKLAASPTALTRLGRVLHWTAFVASLYPILFGGLGIIYTLYKASQGDRENLDYEMQILITWFGVGAAIYLLGRGLRYIISGE